MGQEEIWNLLDKYPGKKYCAYDFAKMLNISNNAAQRSVRQIAKFHGNKLNMVRIKRKSNSPKGMLFICKKRRKGCTN